MSRLQQPKQSMSALGVRLLSLLLAAVVFSGCVTVAEHRKLERRVMDLTRAGGGKAPLERLADLAAEIDALRSEVSELRGRIDVAEKTAGEAALDARRAREELAARAAAEPVEAEKPEQPAVPESEEVRAYRHAYAAWRSADSAACIERFQAFLKTFPASPYADDAAFWMADCHFKQGEYRTAVLRFDDVVRNYPTGNKAADALFRQGESLLKLGPGFHEAARRAFERVLKEYPDSALANEARRQLEVVGTG